MTTIPKTMHAIICHAPDDYRLQEYPAPTPSPGEILLRTHSVGICASDLKCYLGAHLFWGDAHRKGYCQVPVIPGHEFVGEVESPVAHTLELRPHQQCGGLREIDFSVVTCAPCGMGRDHPEAAGAELSHRRRDVPMAPHRNPLGCAGRANHRKLQSAVRWDCVGLQHPDRVAVPEDGGKVVGFVYPVHEHGEVGLASVEHGTQATITLGRQGIPLL